MPFTKYSDEVKEGDLVLAWMTRSNIKPMFIKRGEQFNTRYGVFTHEKLIGRKYGDQVPSTHGNGFIYLIHPTPELWSLSLPHRTQIVYTPDASYIVQRLKIRPGSKVLEAGTGSGSFTHALARTVGSKGHLYTYEYHEPRFIDARVEIETHKLNNVVTITHRDVCNEGFDIENAKIEASAIFLDLPSPWSAIPHISRVVASNRIVNICCFSPCIEQVAKTIEALKANGWKNIEMVEINARKHESRQEMVRDVDDAIGRLRDVKKRRTDGLNKRNNRIESETEGSSTEKRQLEDIDSGNDSTAPNAPKVGGTKGFNPFGKGTRIKQGDEKFKWRNVSRAETEYKSHTSYLTFATLPPPIPANILNEDGTVRGCM
ncbi:adenine-N1--methyltransferase [Nadsonia fulvescens var. elongata DSM 6958]|uniref:tRNA (adenine(58)-N(1))-methyltransferase catalytic subunit TRM61 n=1 Tax=Nadsonia fulvescens var. elongata DSM 6958 TaxID=857566 RepID=A0A1E3PFY5_9ASCO|nr:adenine-N1--methyltransferase [Nadsonia fulvescens var. elongata DSM 6958]